MPPQTKPPNPASRRKCLAFMVAAIILQTLIIVAFVLIFMRTKSPKFRFRSLTLENLTLNSTNSPSFSLRLNGEVTVKNPNFGRFRFPESTISILYRSKAVGSAVVPGTRVGARSSKKVNVTAEVAADSKNDGVLGGDLNSGKITLTSHATLKGKVHLLNVIKKKKTATMNCNMEVNTKTRQVENLQCK